MLYLEKSFPVILRLAHKYQVNILKSQCEQFVEYTNLRLVLYFISQNQKIFILNLKK